VALTIPSSVTVSLKYFELPVVEDFKIIEVPAICKLLSLSNTKEFEREDAEPPLPTMK
jgi:hypothetical protein